MFIAGLAISAAGAALGAISGGNQQRRAAAEANTAKHKANKMNYLAAQETALSIGVQKGFMRQQETANLANLQKAGMAQSAGATAAAAANGIKGNAVQAVMQSINSDYQSAVYEENESSKWQLYDLNVEIQNTYAQADRGTLTPVSTPSSRSIIRNGLMTGALSAGSSAAGHYFKMGVN